ncbi:MAG: DUF86 domain-containing protein [Methanomicrobiaceae archaeon]|nr:DUF86 domain-containing protein [Methanomicrobiaceae archaeon]
MKRDELFLQHIHDEAVFLQDVCADLTYEQLLADPVLQRANVRSIEVIGEATKNVSDGLKEQYRTCPGS